jgi:hypothetical protein
MEYCQECGGDVKIETIFKGSARKRKVARVTCTRCGFQTSIESDYFNNFRDRIDEDIREAEKARRSKETIIIKPDD